MLFTIKNSCRNIGYINFTTLAFKTGTCPSCKSFPKINTRLSAKSLRPSYFYQT